MFGGCGEERKYLKQKKERGALSETTAKCDALAVSGWRGNQVHQVPPVGSEMWQ